MLKLHVLASGSGGNAAVVENATTGSCALIDCGICARDVMGGLQGAGLEPTQIADVLITHDHSDHTKGLGVTLRALAKAGAVPTIHASRAVRAASQPLEEALETDGVGFAPFKAGDALSLGGMIAHVFRTSHDAAESFGFRMEGDGDALGFMTDTGRVLPEAHDALEYVRILALEANHDEQMLREGPYPYHLKRRIASDVGHLSNRQASAELVQLLESMGGGMLEHVVAMHVSQENNLYLLAQKALADELARHEHPARAHAAQQRTPLSVG